MAMNRRQRLARRLWRSQHVEDDRHWEDLSWDDREPYLKLADEATDFFEQNWERKQVRRARRILEDVEDDGA